MRVPVAVVLSMAAANERSMVASAMVRWCLGKQGASEIGRRRTSTGGRMSNCASPPGSD